MEPGKIVYWLQLVANIGILAGLVLVGMQINQSNKIAQASLATAAYQQETDRSLALMGENPSIVLAKGLLEPENLTPDEIMVVLAETDWRLSMMQRNARMEQLGIFNDEWRYLIELNGRILGRRPIAREYLLDNPTPRPWEAEMQRFALEERKHSAKNTFIQKYTDVARSYGEIE